MKNKFFVFDTNVLVSAVLFKYSNPRKAFDMAATSGKIVVSMETFKEFKEVLSRPKFYKYLSGQTKTSVFKDFEELTIFEEISESIDICRDPKDNKFLELAVSAQASCLVTGDKDLLVLHPFRDIPILNPVVFLKSF